MSNKPRSHDTFAGWLAFGLMIIVIAITVLFLKFSDKNDPDHNRMFKTLSEWKHSH